MANILLTASIALITAMSCKTTRTQNSAAKDVILSDRMAGAGYGIMYFKKGFICLATCANQAEFQARVIEGTNDADKVAAARALCSGSARELSKEDFEAFLIQQKSEKLDATEIAMVRGSLMGSAGVKIWSLNVPPEQWLSSLLTMHLYDYIKKNAPKSSGNCAPVEDGILTSQNMPAIEAGARPTDPQIAAAPSPSQVTQVPDPTQNAAVPDPTPHSVPQSGALVDKLLSANALVIGHHSCSTSGYYRFGETDSTFMGVDNNLSKFQIAITRGYDQANGSDKVFLMDVVCPLTGDVPRVCKGTLDDEGPIPVYVEVYHGDFVFQVNKRIWTGDRLRCRN